MFGSLHQPTFRHHLMDSTRRASHAWAALDETTVYLLALRVPLETAFEARRRWTGAVRSLVERASGGDAASVLEAAGPLGREYGSAFAQCRSRLLDVAAPAECQSLHASAVAWFDELVLACRVLQDASATGQIDRMLDANGHLVAAAEQARLFNAEYEALKRKSAGLSRRSV
jgi:hypothetical protein